MKFWHLLVLVVIIISLIFILSIQPDSEQFKTNTHDIKTSRDEIATTYFKDTFSVCHDVPISNSYGILVDSLIVCSNTKNIPATPYFYFEKLPDKFYKNAWYFINLDVTDFSEFQNSPHNIICKTQQSYNILSRKFPDKNIIYTGFTSIDRFDPEIKKDYTRFIHVAGKSPWKGTINIINTWKLHPEWPELLLIWRNDSMAAPINEQDIFKIKNIKLINGYLSDKKLDQLINLYGLHICASEHEGFGHYINEARSVKAVVIYSDAQSMNEFFNEKIGIPIKTTEKGSMNNGLCPIYETSVINIENAIKIAIKTNISDLQKMGHQARVQFLKDKEKFRTTIKNKIIGSRKIPHTVHFIWISHKSPYEDTKIPERYTKFINSWNYNNNTFKYNFWSGKNILNLIQNNFEEFLDFYKNLQTITSKCDFAKLCILYAHGGVCTDLSIICKKDIIPLLETDSYCIIEDIGNNLKSISTNFIATCPQHEFIYNSLSIISSKNPEKELKIPIELYNYFSITKYSFLVGSNCSSLSDCKDKYTLDNFLSKNYMIEENEDLSYKSSTKPSTSPKDITHTNTLLEEQGVNQHEQTINPLAPNDETDISRNTVITTQENPE
jgi:hypothetical protein